MPLDNELSEIELKGGTDGTIIGNSGDKLKVTGGFNEDDAEQPFDLAVAKGNIPNHRLLNKFGRNPTVKSTDFETIWTAGDLYPWPTSAQTVDVASSDPNDTSAGTGARTVELYGLDANYDEIEETITMNGTTDVTSTSSFLRLHRAIVMTAGTSGFNEGVITATHTTSGDVITQIEEEKNQTLQAFYTVPNNHTHYMSSYYAADQSSSAMLTIELYARKVNGLFQLKHTIEASVAPSVPLKLLTFSAKTDIEIRAISQTGNNGLAAGFSGYLVEG